VGGQLVRTVRHVTTTLPAPAPTVPPRADNGRDHAVDALRAFSIVGVVLGHWLITAVVITRTGWSVASPLEHLPALTPISWVLQTLAPFFFAAGFAASVSLARRPDWLRWMRDRLGRILVGVGILVAFWVPILGALMVGGLPFDTLKKAAMFVVSPLWFLGVLVLLMAATPLLRTAVDRIGAWAAVPLVAVVGAADFLQYGAIHVPAAGWIAIPVAWAAPYVLGIAYAQGGLRRRPVAAGLVATGVAASFVLVSYAGYPASMVGVTGADRSNLNPPSLMALALAAIQVGLFLLVRDRLDRSWRPVAHLNRLAMPIYLWHQSALLLTVLAGSAVAAVIPGLIGTPESYGWMLHRLLWLPIFAAVLGGVLIVLSRRRRSAALPLPRQRHAT
jgi:peptidoglycan/LPS O-acetylase OafA/YrhL